MYTYSLSIEDELQAQEIDLCIVKGVKTVEISAKFLTDFYLQKTQINTWSSFFFFNTRNVDKDVFLTNVVLLKIRRFLRLNLWMKNATYHQGE